MRRWLLGLVFFPAFAQVPQISPVNPHVASGGTQQFTCSQPGTWNLAGYSGGPVYGTISQGGLYTAPATTVSEQVVLQCISSAGNGLSGVIITIDPVPTPPPGPCASVCVGIKPITPIEPVTVPATSHDLCNPGDWSYDKYDPQNPTKTLYHYVCVFANIWTRSPLTAF